MRYILVVFILLISCTVKEEPFSASLTDIIDSMIVKYPGYEVIRIQASVINGHNLLFISNTNTYDPYFLDGYLVYKNKLITYVQTDSLSRADILNTNQLHHYKDSIENFRNGYTSTTNSEPIHHLFEIKHNQIVKVDNNVDLICDKVNIQNNSIILNRHLEKVVLTYIRNNPSVLYELRFWKQHKRQYVFLRAMPFYDKDKYDGYFYLGKQLVVLYGTKYSDHLLDARWRTNDGTIPNIKYRMMPDWNFPFPLKIEILPHGDIRIVSVNEGFFIRDH